MLRISSGVAYKHQPFLSSRAGLGQCRTVPRLQPGLIRKPGPVQAFFGLFSKSNSKQQSVADLVKSLEGKKLDLKMQKEKKENILTAIKKLEEFSKESKIKRPQSALTGLTASWRLVFTTKQVFARIVLNVHSYSDASCSTVRSIDRYLVTHYNAGATHAFYGCKLGGDSTRRLLSGMQIAEPAD